MHAVYDAAPCEERPQDRQRERRDDEGKVPGAQQAPLLFHHDRVEVRRRREPRHDRRVLDRVPRPVAAPTEHGVAPPGAGDDADAEKCPRDEREAARRDEPAIAALAEDERRDRIGERHRGEDVAEVEERRVQRHERMVLQQRVRPVPVLRRDRKTRERIRRRCRDEQQEERKHREHDGERGRRKAWNGQRAAERDEGGRAREDRRPEKDRPLEGRPEADDRVEERSLSRVVLGDVEDREVVRREREHHRERRDHDESKGDASRDPRGQECSDVAAPCCVDRGPCPPDRQEERGAERGRAEIAGTHGNEVRWAGVAPVVGAV